MKFNKMPIKNRLVLLSLAAFLVLPNPSYAQAGALNCGPLIYGDWVTDDGESIVTIDDCAQSKICGTISFLSDPDTLDGNNTNPALRSRKLLGSNLLSEFSAGRKNNYKGSIYNPANGKTYKSKLKLTETASLKVKGCVGPFCETQLWVRPNECPKFGGKP